MYMDSKLGLTLEFHAVIYVFQYCNSFLRHVVVDPGVQQYLHGSTLSGGSIRTPYVHN